MATAAKKTYLVKRGVVEAGAGKAKRAVEAGGTIELSDEAGASLVEKGIVEEVAAKAVEPAKEPEKKDPPKEPAK